MTVAKRAGLLATSWLVALAACAAQIERDEGLGLRRLRPESDVFMFNSGFVTPTARVVNGIEEWRDVWLLLQGKSRPRAQLPAVDFDRESVVVVALGLTRSGGHAIQIVSSELRGKSVVIRVRTTAPGQGCIVTSAVTSPADVAIINGVAKEVAFEYDNVILDCSRHSATPLARSEDSEPNVRR